MLISSALARRRALTSESICFVFSGSLVSKGKRLSEKRQSVWSRKWLLIAKVKFLGVGADLPLLQPVMRVQVTKARRVAAVMANGFEIVLLIVLLGTIFIASPIDTSLYAT